MNFKQLPKVELHLHLDCSLSYDVVNRIKPSISREEYISTFRAPPKCTDLADYIQRAGKGFELMQTHEQLRWVTFDLMKQLHEDHVLYAEIRFAPLLHTMGGLSSEEVVSIVNEATSEATKQYGIQSGLILCTLRHYSEEESMETVKLVSQFKGSNVVGFDIAADEAGFPIDNHIRAFEFARENNIKCTAHAGEARGADSMWETLQHFRPTRIGHGVRCIEDKTLMQFLKKQKIHLEVCPTSNIQVDVFDAIENHSINSIFEYGISMSVNTDARTISNVTLTQEYQLLAATFGWSLDHFRKCNLEAINHSFAPDELKEKIRARIEEGYKSND